MTDKSHYFGNDLYIIEGMNMTGKSTFLDKNLPNYKVYNPRRSLPLSTNNREELWMIGYGLIDLFEQVQPIGICNDNCDGIVLNRGIFSSYVYERMYHNRYINRNILDWYKDNDFFKNKIGHIYIRHHDTSTAEEIWNASQSRDQALDPMSCEYDKFNSFADYWKLYSYADQLFREVYHYIGVTPRVFETLPDYQWNEVVWK